MHDHDPFYHARNSRTTCLPNLHDPASFKRSSSQNSRSDAVLPLAIGPARPGYIPNPPLKRQVVPPNETGPLAELNGSFALVLCDVENLSLSARDCGYALCYETLAAKLRTSTKRCSLHAFYSCQAHDHVRTQYFGSSGWIPHPQDIEAVHTYQGKRNRANSDSAIFFSTGVLTSRTAFDTVVIGSGDGDLGCDLARFLSEFNIQRRVITLSLPGSTSARLKARANPFISANLKIGLNCLSKFRPRD